MNTSQSSTDNGFKKVRGDISSVEYDNTDVPTYVVEFNDGSTIYLEYNWGKLYRDDNTIKTPSKVQICGNNANANGDLIDYSDEDLLALKFMSLWVDDWYHELRAMMMIANG